MTGRTPLPQILIRIALAAAMLLGGALHAAASPRISSKTVYFTVSGTTPGEVLQSILSTGPGGHSGVAMATTRANITQRVEPRGNRGCTRKTTVQIITHIPRLSKTSRKNPRLRALWRRFIGYIKRHEARHKSIYIGCAKKIESLVRDHVRKTGCKGALPGVRRIMQAENKRCERLNLAYDRAERPRIRQLGLIRKASGGGLPGIGGVAFGNHDRKASRRLRPNRN